MINCQLTLQVGICTKLNEDERQVEVAEPEVSRSELVN